MKSLIGKRGKGGSGAIISFLLFLFFFFSSFPSFFYNFATLRKNEAEMIFHSDCNMQTGIKKLLILMSLLLYGRNENCLNECPRTEILCVRDVLVI